MKSSKLAARVKPYIGKLEGYVSVIGLHQLNAMITGQSLSIARFAPGDRVCYTGNNEHIRNQYAGVELRVYEVLKSDPRWVCCTYYWERPYLGGIEPRHDFTPWIKSEELRVIR